MEMNSVGFKSLGSFLERPGKGRTIRKVMVGEGNFQLARFFFSAHFRKSPHKQIGGKNLQGTGWSGAWGGFPT